MRFNSTIQEPSRQTPVVEMCDVVVCGGGPAGVAAAIAAGRAGASVRLIEMHGQLGGIWTTGLLCWILDASDKPGVMADILRRLRAHEGAQPHLINGVGYHPEAMKLVLEQMCMEAGIRVRLHTRLAGVHRAGRRIEAVVTESKSGREAFAGKVFIDATGDGDLAAFAGCAFEVGRADDDPSGAPGETQPMTLMAMLGGADERAMHDAGLLRGPDVSPKQSKQAIRKALAAHGVQTSYGDPTLFPVGHGMLGLMTHHAYGRSAFDVDDLTAATIEGRQEVHRVVEALRRCGGPLGKLQLIATAAQIGVREGRRVVGLYRVTADDAIEGRTHADAVCRVNFGFDVHATRASNGKGAGRQAHPAKPFDIPFRALVARDVENLLLAGRCVSGDFLAHSSYRVTGNAVALGEAAGRAAATAATTGRALPEAWK